MDINELRELARKIDQEHCHKIRDMVDNVAKSIPTDGLTIDEIYTVFHFVLDDVVNANCSLGISFNVVRAQAAAAKRMREEDKCQTS